MSGGWILDKGLVFVFQFLKPFWFLVSSKFVIEFVT